MLNIFSTLVAGVRPDGQRGEGRVHSAVGSEAVVSDRLPFLIAEVLGGSLW